MPSMPPQPPPSSLLPHDCGTDFGAQAAYRLRFDWGPVGATVAARSGASAVVVVDVLSFTTAVSVAADRGFPVYPAATETAAAALAASVGARLAGSRGQMAAQQPWSLSPAAIRGAPLPDGGLVLPSPNGSAITTALGASVVVVVAACLRNVDAVAGWLVERRGSGHRPAGGEAEGSIAVVAAGERWPDGSLRPALEDLLGAGAVLQALADRGIGAESPDAAAARAAYTCAAPGIAQAVRSCASGRELVSRGFGGDVEIALEVDGSRAVPVLVDGAFRPVPGPPPPHHA